MQQRGRKGQRRIVTRFQRTVLLHQQKQVGYNRLRHFFCDRFRLDATHRFEGGGEQGPLALQIRMNDRHTQTSYNLSKFRPKIFASRYSSKKFLSNQGEVRGSESLKNLLSTFVQQSENHFAKKEFEVEIFFTSTLE